MPASKTRFENWPTLLSAHVKAASGRPFCWGAQDCAMFACDAVQAIAGWDPGARWRGRYRTQRGALRLIAQAGGLKGMAASVLGEPVRWQQAGRGDLVLLCQPQGYSLGVCLGANFAAPGEHGLIFFGLELAECAWHV